MTTPRFIDEEVRRFAERAKNNPGHGLTASREVAVEVKKLLSGEPLAFDAVLREAFEASKARSTT